ncbi:hypothetical protein EV195_11512 [Tenacibaculum skagerrakense]|uniref:Uncharacterized protein n=1 Tax=Tenacibaculum skagerrakense TaxID=186571 RepID=A0A4R2NJZ6_9FLAO|nr:hypothetical protein [Tenacibaculum skagerrakense]TCP21899.1 hypothetical protein EV195_11512 [Tenacibaculum skagerrakense]
MGFIRKEIAIGFFVSLFATFCGMFIYLQYVSRFGFYETIEMIQKNDILGPVITLAALPNLFVFFIFLKKKQDYRAKGVLIATIVTALVTFALKFF